jgi:glycine/D-amino acid oxidase-like deaminating enzyme
VGRALSTSPPSLWRDTAPPLRPFDPLPGDARDTRGYDVAVVGAGFTGLWTAYYLSEADPTRRIVVLEAEEVGYGASGRNGGWCSALFPASTSTVADRSDREAARALQAAMVGSVDEVGRVCATEGISADFARGGTIALVRSAAQETRARAEVAEAESWGRTDLTWLEADAARDVLAGAGVRGATYTPDCAALHPMKLVRALAGLVTERGVRIHERTRVTEIQPGRVTTTRGTVRADVVVRATEGYTPTLTGHRRTVVPVHSLIVATEPLDEELWSRIGLARRETFTDHRHLIIYGQRTADDRLVFGGRGAPYHFGSRIRPSYDEEPRVFAGLRETLLDLLPQLDGVRFTHSWGGCLGVPRDWFASVGLDPATGIGWAGGYVGDGVSTTNLAGRTLRDLVLGDATALTALPWVGHRSRPWEPEPLRWLGINAGLRAMTWADREEQVSGRPSVLARALAPLLGG